MAKKLNWTLLARFLANECSADEERELHTWIHSDSDNRQLLKFIETVRETPEISPEASDVKKLWNQLAQKAALISESETKEMPVISEKTRLIKKRFSYHTKIYKILRYAAVFLVLAALSYFIFEKSDPLAWFHTVPDLVTVTIKQGDRQRIVLSDGSVVVLDAGSRIRYPGDFAKDKREIYLNGEGYFEVKQDQNRPFFVYAGEAIVKVLGTKFNVRAWTKNNRIQVSVIEGNVSLNSENGTTRDAVIISRGLSSILPDKGLPSQPFNVDLKAITGWMHNEVLFDNAPLHEILFQMERWYDVKFVLSDSSILNEHLNLHIRDNSLNDVLKLLAALTDLKYTYSGKTVYLKDN